jgi:hypothetical protein
MKTIKKTMKKITALLIVLLAVAVPSMAADPAFWRQGITGTGSEVRSGQQYPMPTQDAPTDGFLSYATPTVVIGTSAAVLITTSGAIPTGAHRLWVGVPAGGSYLNYGYSNVPTGSSPFQIAPGAFRIWDLATLTPKLYFRADSASISVVLNAD